MHEEEEQLAVITGVRVGYDSWRGTGITLWVRMLRGGSGPKVPLSLLEEYNIEDSNELIGATCVVSVNEERQVAFKRLHTKADGTDWKAAPND